MASMSSDSAEIRMLYTEARLLLKKTTVLRLQLDQLCKRYKEDVSKMAEQKIHAIRQAERSAIQLLNCIRDEHIESQEWDHFQKYAQEIRKIHLGGSSGIKLPKFKASSIKAYIDDIENAKDKCDAIIADFSQQMHVDATPQHTLPQRDLSFHAVTAQSERLLDKIRTEPSFEISPIKRKENTTESHLPQKDSLLTHNKPSTTITHAKVADRTSFGDPLPSSRKEITKPQLKLSSSVFPANRSIIPPSVHEVTPISLRSPEPNVKNAHQSKPHNEEKMKNTTVRSSAGKLSKVRSEGHLQGGYQGVLEILQLQQLRFDKLKHGIE